MGCYTDSTAVAPNPNPGNYSNPQNNALAEVVSTTWPLDGGKQFTVQWPSKISQNDFQEIKDVLEMLEKKVARAVDAPQGKER